MEWRLDILKLQNILHLQKKYLSTYLYQISWLIFAKNVENPDKKNVITKTTCRINTC